MKIAQYKSLDKGDGCGSWTSIQEVNDWIDRTGGYLRLTEFLEVDFTPLPPDQTIPLQLASIDARCEALTNRYLLQKSKLETERSELLAISAPVAT